MALPTGYLVACVLVLSSLVTFSTGFAVHKRHLHLHPRQHHHAHHHRVRHEHHVDARPVLPLPGDPPASEDAAVVVDQAPDLGSNADVAALLEAIEASDLSDSFGGAPGDGIPLFMKMLLRDTQEGVIFQDYSQPVPAPLSGPAPRNKTLASCVQPSRVSVGRTGAMVVEFPSSSTSPMADGSCQWLVLGLQPEVAAANLVVYMAPHGAHALHQVVELPLPNATFLAVNVTKATRQSSGTSLRFLVDVNAPVESASSRRTSAAAAFEVAGWERGPLLVNSLPSEWQGHSEHGGSIRVWRDVPHDLLHPPQARNRRRSHRRTSTTSTTTTERSSSAENPLRNAAMNSDSNPATEEGDTDSCCHLEAWTVSVESLWDFIVFPTEIGINFCVGRCPTSLLYDKHYNASTNAMARTGFKMERGENGVNIPDALCVPIRYRPIALVLKNKESVDLYNSYDLSADRCGCR